MADRLQPPKPVLPAILLVLVASMFFSASSFLSKLLGTQIIGDGIHPLQVTHSRFFFGFMLAAILFLTTRTRLEKPNIGLHLLRSTFGWIGVGILFTGLVHIPAPDAMALTFLNPIFAMGFAVLFLGERVGINRWMAAAIAFCGALLLIRPTGDAVNPIALLCVLGAVIMGLEITCIKVLSGRENVFQILLINNFMAMCLASLPLFFVFAVPSLAELIALAGVGLTMVTGQLFFIRAMARAESSLITPFIYAALVFIMALDAMVLGVVPDAISIAGSTIIVASGIFIAWREAHIARRQG